MEILISLLLTSIVVLGIFAAQGQQTQKAVTLKQYMLASLGLRNMAEKMLANQISMQGNDYTESYKSQVKDCINLNCNPREMAAYDINTTVNEMREHLPQFELKIIAQTAGDYKLSASWQGLTKSQTLDLKISAGQ